MIYGMFLEIDIDDIYEIDLEILIVYTKDGKVVPFNLWPWKELYAVCYVGDDKQC